MQYRKLGAISDRVSALGFGCMRFPGKMINEEWIWDEKLACQMIRRAIDLGVNYVDTAYTYSDSQNERIVGQALADGYREKVFLTTKLPWWVCESGEDFPKVLETQLSQLKTDHLDLYLVHAINWEKWVKMRDFGVIPFLKKMKEEGKIRHYGFSFHGPFEELKAILDDEASFEAVQLQFNYYDTDRQAGEAGLKLCHDRGLPVIIMEGLRGGKLANVPEEIRSLFASSGEDRSPAEWGFRFLLDKPEVGIVLSGMTDLSMVEDNVRIFSDSEIGCLTEDQRRMMVRAKEMLEARTKIDCTGCEYCLPCPQGVRIPGIFSVWNEGAIFGQMTEAQGRYARIREKGEDASRCVSCRLCESLCPQSLPISDALKRADSELSNL